MTSAVQVTPLTPPGTAAIAVLQLRGHGAWARLREVFHRPNGQQLPEEPDFARVWYGTLGEGEGHGDEVVLSVTSVEPPIFEVHGHGGPRVQRWLIEQLRGTVAAPLPAPHPAWELVQYAPTLRMANLILEQTAGVRPSACAVRGAELTRIGLHLIHPWSVVLAGPPNAGKSSLLNALVGFQRAVVAPIAGTTRDVVSFTTAIDGWPIQLSDTAGLRDSWDALELAGIARAEAMLHDADLVLWLEDPSEAEAPPPAGLANVLRVANKADLAAATWPTDIAVSAHTGAGVSLLLELIVRRLVPHPPLPGEMIPLPPKSR